MLDRFPEVERYCRVLAGPTGNSSATAVVSVPFLDAADCDEIIGFVSEAEWVDAQVNISDRDRSTSVRPEVRYVSQVRLTEMADGGLFRALGDRITALNGRYWNFVLSGFSPADRIGVLRYSGSRYDHYKVHVDTGREASTRKLSFVVQLTDSDDYQGGELQFPTFNEVAARERGSLTVFPSFLPHRVEPVRKGHRLALVGWVHGPTYR